MFILQRQDKDTWLSMEKSNHCLSQNDLEVLLIHVWRKKEKGP